MDDIPDAQAGWGESFRTSRWFTRGWTLQELIAPTYLEFYALDWAAIGTKAERYGEISDVTNINADVLIRGKPIGAFSAAEKLSWAAHRNVTREEDETYCLLGIFEVNMPMLYGEGSRRAFFRLQTAIYSSTIDHSLFLFSWSPYGWKQSLLADCPAWFCQKQGSCSQCSSGAQLFPNTISYAKLTPTRNSNVRTHDQIWATTTSSRTQVSTTLQLLEFSDVVGQLVSLEAGFYFPFPPSHIAVLNHTLEDQRSGALCLPLDLRRESDGSSTAFVRPSSYPVILPRVDEFATKMYSERVLVASAPDEPGSQTTSVLTNFTFTSELFVVEYWRSKNKYDKQEVKNERQTNADSNFEAVSILWHQPEVSCCITDAVEHAKQIEIRLGITIGMNWHIRRVDELSSRRTPGTQHTLFSGQILCDRCSVVTSDGLRWSIALRRLPGSRLEHSDVMRPRYQIRVSRAEMSTPSLTQIIRRT